MSAVTRGDEWVDAPRALSIVHDIPGRLRMRLPPGATTAGLGEALERLNGVQSSVWSPRTRSLLIRYDPSVLTAAEIKRTVAEDADLDLPASSSEPRDEDGRPQIARAVLDVFDGFNERVGRRTRGRLNLGMVFAVGLVLWSMRQLLRGPVTSLSWTSALWYAHGLFRDYAATRER
jgi:hypothetical protein